MAKVVDVRVSSQFLIEAMGLDHDEYPDIVVTRAVTDHRCYGNVILRLECPKAKDWPEINEGDDVPITTVQVTRIKGKVRI